MSELKDFFNERKKEINIYFTLLDNLRIDEYPSHHFNAKIAEGQEINMILGSDQIKILKSNCFLLLYNIIEGTVNRSLVYMIDSINEYDEILKNKDVINEIKEIWFKSSLLTNSTKGDDRKIAEHIETFINAKIDIKLVQFRKENKSYFGSSNLTDIIIAEELLPKLGIYSMPVREAKIEEIKNIRNDLAHGNKSFTEIGSTKTFRDIKIYKNKIFKFLEKYIEIIDKYVEEETYKI